MPQSVDGDIRLSVGIDTAPAKKKFSDLGRNIVSVFKSFSTPKGLEETDAKIIELTKEADSAASRIKELSEQIAGIPKIETSSTEFSKLAAETDRVGNMIEELQNRKTDLLATTTKTASTYQELEKIETRLSSLYNYMDELVTKMDDVQAEQERQEENNRRLETLNAQLSQAQS